MLVLRAGLWLPLTGCGCRGDLETGVAGCCRKPGCSLSQRRTHLTGQINTVGTLRHEGDARVFSVGPRHIAAKARENNQ